MRKKHVSCKTNVISKGEFKIAFGHGAKGELMSRRNQKAKIFVKSFPDARLRSEKRRRKMGGMKGLKFYLL